MDKILKIEITDRCNARCVFCNYNKTNTDMTYEMFVSIVEQMPEIENVEPQHIGEALLHPRFLDILSYLRDQGKRIAFHTNGFLLKGDLAKGVAEIAPETIRFSIEADNKELYEQLRVGLKWETVLENIEHFQLIKSPQTETSVVMLITEENRNDIDRIVKFWRGRVDKVSVTHETPHGRELIGHLLDRPLNCWKIESMITIKVDGGIVLCCQDWDGEHIIGHVSEGIKNVINGSKAKKLINQVKSNKPLPICKNCTIFWEGD